MQESDDDMNLTLTTTRTGEPEMGMETTTITAYSQCGRGDPCGDRHQLGVEPKDKDASLLGVFQFSRLHIRGSSIRFIHFTDNADLPALIKLGFDRKRAVSDKYARGKRQKR